MVKASKCARRLVLCSSAGRSDGGGGGTSHEVQRNTTFLSEGRVFPRQNRVVVQWFPLKPDFSLGGSRVSKRKQGRRPMVCTETRLFSRRVACFQEKTGSSSDGFLDEQTSAPSHCFVTGRPTEIKIVDTRRGASDLVVSRASSTVSFPRKVKNFVHFFHFQK